MNGELLSLYSKYDPEKYSVFSLDGNQLKDYDGALLSRTDSVPQALGFPLQEYYGTWVSELDGQNNYMMRIEEKTNRIYITSIDENSSVRYSYVKSYTYENGKVIVREENGAELELLLYEDGTLHMADASDITLKKVDSCPSYDMPTPFDEKTMEFTPANKSDMTFRIPETFGAVDSWTDENNLWLSPVTARPSHEQDDNHSVIGMAVTNWSDKEEKYLSMGEYVAWSYVQMFVNNMAQIFFKDKLVNTHAYEFVNGGDYYEMTLLCNLAPGYLFSDNYEVCGAITVRYVDHGTISNVLVVPPANLDSYLAISDSLLDEIQYQDNGWTTAGTDIPDTQAALQAYQEILAASSAGTQTQSQAKPVANTTPVSQSQAPSGGYAPAHLVNNSGASSRTGSEGVISPFFWTDADGYIWYWNGCEDILYAYEGDFYTEDGMIYESNDAGWDDDLSYDYDYDYYNDWSDPGDYADWSDPGDYADWSDPGDYADWSDPGDTYDVDDYMEPQDYEQYDDYNTDYEYDDYDYYEDDGWGDY